MHAALLADAVPCRSLSPALSSLRGELRGSHGVWGYITRRGTASDADDEISVPAIAATDSTTS